MTTQNYISDYPESHQPVQVRSAAHGQIFFYHGKRFDAAHVPPDGTSWSDAAPYDISGMTKVTVQVDVISGAGAFTVHVKGALGATDTPYDLDPSAITLTAAGLKTVTANVPYLFLSVDNPNHVELSIKIYATR